MIGALTKVLLALLALWELSVAWLSFFGSRENPHSFAVDSNVRFVAVILPLYLVVPILLVLWGWHFVRRVAARSYSAGHFGRATTPSKVDDGKA